jgi:hypothetical protein
MKNTIVLAVALAACPVLKAQTKLAGKIFKPVSIETNGLKQSVSADSIPFAMEFIDEKNIVYREMKSNYYVLHHCVYKIKNNELSIEFLSKRRSPLVYQIQSSDNHKLELKDDSRTIFMNKTTD